MSNLKQIVVTATATGSGLKLESLRTDGPDANLDVIVTNASGVEFPKDLFLISAGTRGDAETALIGFGVPIAEEQRNAEIEAFVQASRNDPARDEESRILFDGLRDVMVARFQRRFFENRLGEFEVSCRYFPEKPGFWNGELESEAEQIEVVSEGSFFSQPQFRR